MLLGESTGLRSIGYCCGDDNQESDLNMCAGILRNCSTYCIHTQIMSMEYGGELEVYLSSMSYFISGKARQSL